MAQCTVDVVPEEIVASVRSLYADGLQPFGRILLKRLRERAAERFAASQGLPVDTVDPDTVVAQVATKALRAACEACDLLEVRPEEGKEYTLLVKGEAAEFLDVTSGADPYPEHLWHAFSELVESWGDDVSLPGGRYACAREVFRMNVPFVSGLSLAQVCHVVHLASTQRGLLGRRDGRLVAFCFSSERIKAECASAQAPTGKESLPAATWEQARACFRTLVVSPPASEPAGITISNVKRLFRSCFGLELSETALGHIRLVDLLRDPRFGDIFTTYDQRNGQLALTAVACQMAPLSAMWVSPAQVVFVPSPVLLVMHQCALERVALPTLVLPDSGELLSPGASPRGSASPVQFEKACSSAGSTTDDDDTWPSTTSTASDDLEQDQEDALSLDLEIETAWTLQVKRTFIDIAMTSRAGAARRSRSAPHGRRGSAMDN